MYDYATLENKLRPVVSYFAERIKDDEGVKDINELIDHHGEYGEAFHLLCFLVAQEHIAISPEVYEVLVDLGKQLGMDETLWPLIVALRDPEIH